LNRVHVTRMAELWTALRGVENQHRLFRLRLVLAVAPMRRPSTIRIKRNDIEVLYAPRPSANPSATEECPDLISAPQIVS